MKPKCEHWNVIGPYSCARAHVGGDHSFGRRRIAHWAALISTFVVGVIPAGAQELQVGPINAPPMNPVIADVRLDQNGQWSGRVVSQVHAPVPGTTVQLYRAASEPPREASTDANGVFVFRDAGTGLFQLTSGGTTQHVRVWSATSAPPAATDQLVLVHSPTTIVRGQRPMCDLTCGEPIMIGVLVAAAIAIPLALHDSGEGS